MYHTRRLHPCFTLFFLYLPAFFFIFLHIVTSRRDINLLAREKIAGKLASRFLRHVEQTEFYHMPALMYNDFNVYFIFVSGKLVDLFTVDRLQVVSCLILVYFVFVNAILLIWQCAFYYSCFIVFAQRCNF